MARAPLLRRSAPFGLLLAACSPEAPREAADTPRAAAAHALGAPRLLADSATADSAAFTALPPGLRASLDVRRLLTPAALADTSRVLCQLQRPEDPAEERRRLRFRLPDTVGILFVRADRATGALQRVELVRRPLTTKLQQGFSWDAADDVTREIEWVADLPSAVETGPLPRGGPAPRALRGLGRLLLVLPCPGPSGS